MKLFIIIIFMLILTNSPAHAAQQNFTNSVGIEFVLIPAGNFMMGSADDINAANNDERPAHQITLSKAFYFAKFETTQANWEKVMGENPFKMQRTRSSWESLLKTGRFYGPKKPATVSWNDAQNFIKKLNELEGHNKYRLPTEAEWEYAGRANTQSSYFFGNDFNDLSSYAWHNESFNTGSIHETGQKKPNSWGLYDIHGNVWEWVNDWYDKDYYTNSPPIDPPGPLTGTEKIVRGGSWHSSADSWRIAFKKAYPADYRGISIGFRLLLEL